jgi:photosystem II stability/assembly factor-like uncharacterized protein
LSLFPIRPYKQNLSKIMHNLRLFLIFGLTFLSSFAALAQPQWMQLAEKKSNFYEIKAAFLKENEARLKTYYQNLRQKDEEPRDETFQAEHELEEYQDIIHFMRIADWVEPRVAEFNGNMDALIESDFRARLLLQKNATQRTAASWTVIGPLGRSSMSGNGRVNSIKVDPNNAATLYACTPAGQLWKSTNNGGAWAVISDGIPALGVTNVAIDPTNSNILYALTGDADQAIYHPSSRGLYKSINGGASWSPTGLNYTSGSILLCDVLVLPTNTNVILVGGTNGIWRSTNGGTNFTQVNTSSIRELVFNPQDSKTVFAASKTGAVLLRSYDSGITWTQMTTGLPTSTVARRFSIDVSPVDTNYVYLMATNISSAMEGFYQSIDGGTSFTQKTTTPNIPSAQGWYDLAVVCDPTSKTTVYGAGFSVYRSIDGAATFTNISIPHVDVHDLQFNGSSLLASSDGGVYRYSGTGTTWSDISSNLAISQPYGIGLSATNANTIIMGLQDNGTNVTTNLSTWTARSGGDGMIAFVDKTNANNMYCTYQNGVLRRSTNGGASFSTAWQVPNGYWVTPYLQDPQVPTTVYAGGFNLYKSIDSGVTWDSISNFGTALQIRWIDVARTNNKIIYFTTASAIYKTIDGGVNWTNVTGTVPTTTHLCIHIDVNDPNKVYCTLAATSANQVYFTNNGGTTWTNISTGLPGSPANTIVTQVGLSDVAYCGTDLGVYYRNPATSSSWQSFNAGLPVVPVRDLEIQYNIGKIRAATFGRGIWESSLDAIALPVELLNFQGNLVSDNVKTDRNTAAQINNNAILLTWQTASEVRFHHFELEHSPDSKSWAKLMDKEAKGSASAYQTLDEKPIFGVNYYRLKMVDTDGTFTYSKIVAIELSKPYSKEWVLFPNPVKDKLFISGNEDVSGSVNVQIVDISGKILHSTTIQQLRTGLAINNLPNGIYFLDINNQQKVERKEFVVKL